MDLKKLDVKRNEIILGKKYLLKERLGGGSFGQTFCAINQDNQARVAAKLEKRSPNATLVREAKTISDMRGETGFPSLYDYGKEENYNYIIISLLGWNLEKLFKACSHRFSLKTVLMIADQMLSRIEALHNKNYLHRDIKPENFCIGKGSSSRIVYMIDFGLAKSYKDSAGKHISFKDNKGLVGTARYASLNTHNGQEQSRRDDLEAIGYTLVYFLLGKLPWQNLKVEEKYKKYQKIAELKTKIPLVELCQGLPKEFITYMEYVRTLQFMENPDYKYLKKLFRTLFIENGYDFDYHYDWIEVFKTQYSIDTTATPQLRFRDDESKEYNAALGDSRPYLKGELHASPQVKYMKNLQDKNTHSPNPTSRHLSSKPVFSDDNKPKDLTDEEVKPNTLHRMSAKLTTYPKISAVVGTHEGTQGGTNGDNSPRRKTVRQGSLWKNMSINTSGASDKESSKDDFEDEIPVEIVMYNSQVGLVKQFPLKKKITIFGESEEVLMTNTNRDEVLPTLDKVGQKGKPKAYVASSVPKEAKRSPFASTSLIDAKHLEVRPFNEGDLNDSSICEWDEGVNLDQMINEKRFFVNNKYH